MSNPSKIKSKEYRNWVRGALGLFYLQRGLYPFTDRVVKAEHARLVQNISPCTRCAIENILPDHASSKVCIQKNKARCNCRKKTNTNCATCGKIYDQIVLQHRFREPHWVTDSSKWYSDHWQFAKCFLTTTSKGSNNTAAETDASGLLSIIINGLFIQSDIQCNIDPPNDSFSLVREMRNEILHKSTLDLTDQDVARYLQSMISVLEDKKALSLDPAAQAAATKLKQILNDELIITTNEEANAIQAALDAIKEVKEQSEDSIRKLAEEKQNAIKASEENIRTLAEEKQNAFKTSEDSIRKLAEEKQIAIKESEDSIRKLAEEKGNDMRASEENIRKLAEEKEKAIKASEKNIKGITEESLNALQQQTLESATEIKTVKEDAIENVTSTVSVVIKETYEPEMKILYSRQDDHENRLKVIELEQQRLQLKQLDLEKQVAKLKTTEEKHQTRLEYIKQKQGLQQYLVDVYQRHHVKTSISPLMTQHNDVNIGDVYVSPRMVVEENKDGKDGNTTKYGKDRKANYKHIERYRDLFRTGEKRNRNIFMIGDVGTGKSSFCKMMIQDWCSAITNRGAGSESGVLEEQDSKQGEECNTRDLNQFDYLFYIPLREMSGNINDTVDMIKAQLEGYKVLIDDIFRSDSERILILADGLDEWTPPRLNRPLSLHHVTVGIPASHSARNSTTIITSRPSSRGILNMKSSEYDLKVTLLGLNYTSVQPMIEKYMKFLNKTSAVSDFEKKLSLIELKDIQNAPLLLQQIIWLYCNNYDIGQSRSLIYINIINIILAWEDGRNVAEPTLHDFQSSDLKRLPLPKYFDKFVRCQENRKLLIFLGKVAYYAYIKDSDSSLVFGRNKLKQLGASDDDISAILRTGILTEINSSDPTYEKSRLSFIHTSYLEFFAALYICSCYLSKIPYAHSLDAHFNIFKKLIALTMTTSIVDVLRLGNVFIMMCGLVPCLFGHLLECIDMSSFDDSFSVQTKELFLDCLSEHNSMNQETITNIKQSQLYVPGYLNDKRFKVFLRSLDPLSIKRCSINDGYWLKSHEQYSLLSSFLSQAVSLRTLKINDKTCYEDRCIGHIIDLTNHKKLQSLTLSQTSISVSGVSHTCLKSCIISECELTHEQYSMLSSYLSQAMSLRTLIMEGVKCVKDECEGHYIDLTNHKKLQSLTLSKSKIVSGVNHTSLTSCFISDCELRHEQCSLLSLCLSKAVSLRTLEIRSIECAKDVCAGHIIDLTNHKKLQSLELFESKISVSGVNSTCLRSCVISCSNLSQEQISLSLSFLSQAVSLQTLEIDFLDCTKTKCEGHIINLSNHIKLQSLWLSGIEISVYGINHTCLESCVISYLELGHEHFSILSSFLSQAVSLRDLEIEKIKCTEDECEGHIIDLTEHNKIQSLKLSESNISVYGINQIGLESCVISYLELGHEHCSILSSFLSQAVSLRDLEIEKIKCTVDECEGHILYLANHIKMKRLALSGISISVCGINHTCLESCVILDCELSHEHCSLLSSCLSQAVSLRTLKIGKTKCSEDEYESHIIDLTNLKQLQSLTLSRTSISVSGVNHTCLESCVISGCELAHEQCSLLSSCLSQAVSLKTLEIEGIECTDKKCQGHLFDFTNHNNLQRLDLSGLTNLFSCRRTYLLMSGICSKISVSGINNTCLGSCVVSDCELSHKQCTLLTSCLSQVVSLQNLEINRIECTLDECEGHIIDFTNHEQLQSLRLSRTRITVSGINHTCHLSCVISSCELSHQQCSLLSSCLSQAASLRSIKIDNIECTNDQCDSHIIHLNHHKQLQSLDLSGSKITVSGINHDSRLGFCVIAKCELSHEQCSMLYSCLSHAVSLLVVNLNNIECTQDACEGHIIDFTNHKQLRSLNLSGSKIVVSGINHTCRGSCVITGCVLSHEQCSLLSSCLSQALSLQKLEIDSIGCLKDECEGHIIDLTSYKKLRSVKLSRTRISVSSINPTNLESCDISGCELSHEQCSLLSSCLSQALSLQTLEIDSIGCLKDECEGHIIDLTSFKKLKSVKLSRTRISVSGINLTNLESCDISGCELSHEQCSLFSSCLSQALSLQTLEIDSIGCLKDECEGHIIDLTSYKKLKSVKLSRTRISVSGINLTNLESCDISGCELSHEQCSLLSLCLSQAVLLWTVNIDNIECTQDECEGHIIDLTNHKKLQSLELSGSKISSSGVNYTSLESCVISDCVLSHEQCSLLLSSLSLEGSLKTLEIFDIECTKDECEGHIIDLTNHKKLQSLSLSGRKISVSGISHICLESCGISDCELSHEQCSLLSSCMSQALSIQTLEIYNIVCTKDECEGHIIDLTNHKKLQSLELSGSKISVSGVNHTSLESCVISDCALSHEQCSRLSSSLSLACSLQTLEIYNIKCTKDQCEGHIIDLTNHRKLQSLEISGNKMSFTGLRDKVGNPQVAQRDKNENVAGSV